MKVDFFSLFVEKKRRQDTSDEKTNDEQEAHPLKNKFDTCIFHSLFSCSVSRGDSIANNKFAILETLELLTYILTSCGFAQKFCW